MQGLILAAGMGSRLGKHTKNNTKCMVKINGKTIIEYALEALSTSNMNRIIIVTGYQGEKLKSFLGNNYNGIPIEYIDNHKYEKTNNIYSLWLAGSAFQEDDTILLESDIVFEDRIIESIVKDSNPNIAVVAKFEPWMDGTVTSLDSSSNIISFIEKKNFQWNCIDNYYKTVNIYKFSKEFIRNCYLPFLKSYINVFGENEYYEQVLRVLTYLNNINLKAYKIGKEKWYEIDDIQDVDIAEAIFANKENKLRLLQKRFGGYWRFPTMKDFCYLVNPYFPPLEMKEELKSSFDTILAHYPSGQDIQNLLAAKLFCCEQEEIIVGNGATELIKGLFSVLKGKVGVIYPTFNEYPECVGEERVEKFIPLDSSYNYTIEELKVFSKKVDTLLIINPDNPSGHFFSKEEVLDLIEYLKEENKTIVFDESFIDFAGVHSEYTLINSEYIQEYKNLIVIKSISKSYGVPGIRLGVLATGNVELMKNIRKKLSIWNINSTAEYFLQIIGKYLNDYISACNKINDERDRFYKELDKISFLRVIPSKANYFLCEVTSSISATWLTRNLLNNYNILIKDCTGKVGFNNKEFVRIAVRNRSDNEFIIEKLKEIEENTLYYRQVAVN